LERTVGLLALLGTAVLFASLGVLATVIGSMRSGEAAERPNIIFVLTDDQFPGTESMMPNLKNNITSQGVEFTNMTSTFPLCCPGRATILRGQYAHNTRIYGNNLPVGGWEKFRNRGLENSTIATWLNDAGYRTGLFGKYMNNYRALTVPRGWDRWYAWNGVKEGWTALNDQGNQEPLTRQEADSGVSKAALKFLGNHVGNRAPVFAFVNFGAAHNPYPHAQVDAEKFQGTGVPRNSAFNEDDVADKPSYISSLPPLSGSDTSDLDEYYRRGLRSLMRVDRFVGSASDLLRSKGEMRETYFVFYTDNGSHFGQHRFGRGKLQPYEDDVNFPLIMRGPGIPHGVRNGELVGNHDIAPTIARMGGANIPSFVDGRNFLTLAQDSDISRYRTAILSEGRTEDVPQTNWSMLRMREKIYTRYENGEREYYDLTVDPYQVNNALGPSDTTYPPPGNATLTYYKRRLDALDACTGRKGPESCGEAEDAPVDPASSLP